MITVVLTAWDRYATWPLLEAVGSLLAQDLEAEVIVVDNASEPPIAPIEGCRIVRLEERRVLGLARNAGLDAVDTPYMVFWDADDIMLPGTMRAMHEALEAAGESTVACACAIIDGATDRRSHWPRRWAGKLARHRRLFAWVNALWCQYPVNTALVRTEAIRSAGGFPAADQGEDWALGVSLAFRGRVLLLDRPGLWYRQSTTSLSAGWRSFPHVSRNAALVRERIRGDHAIPAWVRASLPALVALQLAIMLFVRPPVRLLRQWRARQLRADPRHRGELAGQQGEGDEPHGVADLLATPAD